MTFGKIDKGLERRMGLIIVEWRRELCIGGLAQLANAFASRAKEWEFESLIPHHFLIFVNFILILVLKIDILYVEKI